MSPLGHLVREIYRRGVWQVRGVLAVAFSAALQAADTLAGSAGGRRRTASHPIQEVTVPKTRLSRITVVQSAKVVASVYAVGILIFVPFMLVAAVLEPDIGLATGLVTAFLAPVVYFVFTFVLVAIFCWLYNVIAGRMGGVEFELSEGG